MPGRGGDRFREEVSSMCFFSHHFGLTSTPQLMTRRLSQRSVGAFVKGSNSFGVGLFFASGNAGSTNSVGTCPPKNSFTRTTTSPAGFFGLSSSLRQPEDFGVRKKRSRVRLDLALADHRHLKCYTSSQDTHKSHPGDKAIPGTCKIKIPRPYCSPELP